MQDIPKGPGAEKNSGDANAPGIYELKTADGIKRVITSAGSTGLNEGGTHADALVRLGFTRVADVPSREEILALQKAQAAKDAKEAQPSTPAPQVPQNK